MSSNEDVVVQVMQEENCKGRENMITPQQLVNKCKDKGLDSEKVIEAAIVSLIDQDVIEYEIDDKTLQTTELWLL